MYAPVAKALRSGFVLSLLGALLVGSAIGWLVLGGGGSSGTSSGPARSAIQVSLRRGIYPTIGLALEQPTSWLTSTPGGVLRLASPDAGQTSIAISDIGPAGTDARLRPRLNSQLVKSFQPARVISQKHNRIGKTPAITTAIYGTGSAKHRILILSTAVSSRYLTYSIQVFFNAQTPTRQSILEVNSMLNSISFFAPTG